MAQMSAAGSTSSLMDSMDETPPSVRTQQMVDRRLGANRAARSACMAIATGDRLTQRQKKALFRLGRAQGVADRAVVSVIKQSDGVGVTPMELRGLEDAATKSGVSASLMNGFGWMAAENAGPGSVSVILEAQGWLYGRETAANLSTEEVQAVGVLRSLIFGREIRERHIKIRPSHMAEFIQTVTGAFGDAEASAAEKFWTRFARDALAIPESAEHIMLQQLLLGRGVGEWSSSHMQVRDQAEVLPRLIHSIEAGDPPVTNAPPDAVAVRVGAQRLKACFDSHKHHMDIDEVATIFGEVSKKSKQLPIEDLELVLIAVVRTARDGLRSDKTQTQRRIDTETDELKDLLRHWQLGLGQPRLVDTFGPESIDKGTFLDGFLRYLADMAGEEYVETQQTRDTLNSDGGGGGGDDDDDDDDDDDAVEGVDGDSTPIGSPMGSPRAQITIEKQKQKQSKKARKTRAKASKKGVNPRADSEEEDARDDEQGLLAPTGATEFLRFMAQRGGDAPKALATTLYIAVNEQMSALQAKALQRLVVGTDLDASNVESLLNLMTRNQSKTSVFGQMCEVAFEKKLAGLETIKAAYVEMLQGLAFQESIEFLLGVGTSSLARFVRAQARLLGLQCHTERGSPVQITVTNTARDTDSRAPGGMPLQEPDPEPEYRPRTIVDSGSDFNDMDSTAAVLGSAAVAGGANVKRKKKKEKMSKKDKKGKKKAGVESSGNNEAAADGDTDNDSFKADSSKKGKKSKKKEKSSKKDKKKGKKNADVEFGEDQTAIDDTDNDSFEADSSGKGKKSKKKEKSSKKEKKKGKKGKKNADVEFGAQADADDEKGGDIVFHSSSSDDDEKGGEATPGEHIRDSSTHTESMLANSLTHIACAQSHLLGEEELTELYVFAREYLTPELMGPSGLGGLLGTSWPTAIVEQYETPASPRSPIAKGRILNPEADDSDDEDFDAVNFANPMAEGFDDQGGERMGLSARLQGGRKKTKKAKGAKEFGDEEESDAFDNVDGNDKWDESDEEEEEEDWGSKSEDEDEEIDKPLSKKQLKKLAKAEKAAEDAAKERQFLEEKQLDTPLSKKEEKKLAKVKRAQERRAAAAAAAVAATASGADLGADGMVDPLSLSFDNDSPPPSPRSPYVDESGSMSPATLRRFAKDFKPDIVPSLYQSLISILVDQSKDYHTLAAFQALIERKALNATHLAALERIAARQKIQPEVIRVLAWLWSGGATESDQQARDMIAQNGGFDVNAMSPRSAAPQKRGLLTVEIVSGHELLNLAKRGTSDPFCTVRAEGHQRNTHVVKNSLNPKWDWSATYRVTDFATAVIEIALFDENIAFDIRPSKGKRSTQVMGRVTFPLHVVEPDVPFEATFEVEPAEGMHQRSGELGELTLKLLFEESMEDVMTPECRTSAAVEGLLKMCAHKRISSVAQTRIRQAAEIVINRTEADLNSGGNASEFGREESYETLQKQACSDDFASGVDASGLCSDDTNYDAAEDKIAEKRMKRPLRAKYMSAIAYVLGKFLGINTAVLSVIEGTLNKFSPAPEVVGSFTAVSLGMLGMPERSLSGLKRLLSDRRLERMEKLARSARMDNAWYTQIQRLCRGQGCAQKRCDHANSLVATADSFATAGALYRLRHGLLAAEAEELVELENVIKEGGNDYVIAGVQNLYEMIWPAREDTFVQVREMLEGNSKGEAGLEGWENRAELALILGHDSVAISCLKGLIQMEKLRVYLNEHDKESELAALDLLMHGDKTALRFMRQLTPSIWDRVSEWWGGMSLYAKARFLMMASFATVVIGMWVAKKILTMVPGLADSWAGMLILKLFDVVLLTATAISAVFVFAWWIMRGVPYRDAVLGPNPEGVEILRKFCENELNSETKEQAMDALQNMLMGQIPDAEGHSFLRGRAEEFREKAPSAMEALECLECIQVLQDAGKDSSKIKAFNQTPQWPSISLLWPPNKYKIYEYFAEFKAKASSFLDTVQMNPWMKKYVTYAGDRHELYTQVEVLLTMQMDNEWKLEALYQLRDGIRVDTAGLEPLYHELGIIFENGEVDIQVAIHKHLSGTKKTRAIFDDLDEEGNGSLDEDEMRAAAAALAYNFGFHITEEACTAALDSQGEITFEAFDSWWKEFSLEKAQQRAKREEQLQAAGLLAATPKPSELKPLLKTLSFLLPTVGLSMPTFEALEDLCPDDDTFDCLQEAFHLCELKRSMLGENIAMDAIAGLEAMCMIPLLLAGDETGKVPANEAALLIVEQVQEGHQAALDALAYLRQPRHRRLYGMLTQRQRRILISIGVILLGPVAWLVGIFDAVPVSGLLDLDMLLEFNTTNSTNLTNATLCNTSDLVDCGTVNSTLDVGSWTYDVEDVEDGQATGVSPESNSGDVSEDEAINPSFFVLGFLPLAITIFVTFFGQRIASIITLLCVFVASAGATIGAALSAPGEFSPAKFVLVFMGLYAGSIATKVASSNISFAYGVQGASVGVVVSRLLTFVWRPMLLENVPEICPLKAHRLGFAQGMGDAESLALLPCQLDWAELAVGASFATGAAWASNAYRGLISIIATCTIGTFGFVEVCSGYGISGMNQFRIGNLMTGGVSCTDNDCWSSLAIVLGALVGGTANQLKLKSMNFNLSPKSAYERLLHRVENVMRLLFAINEFIDGAVDLDTDDLMERCLHARDMLVNYINAITNLMHFSLCFGFAADFAIQYELGIYNAVPWVGMCSLGMALVTPFQGGLGLLSSTFTSKRFATRMKEVVVPSWISSNCSRRIPILGKPSFIIKFGPIGRKLQDLAFYLSMVNIFVNIGISVICYLVSDMVGMAVGTQLPIEGFDVDLDEAMLRVSAAVAGLGDSSLGLLAVLASGIATAAYDMGGVNWLIVNIVDMESFFVLNSGALIALIGAKMASDIPAGGLSFVPMALTGAATTLFGAVQSVPWFQQKFPDLMWKLHQFQLVIAGGLCLSFMQMLTTARSAASFVEDNWDGCEFATFCDYLGKGDFKLSEYAAKEYPGITMASFGMVLRPILYGCAVSNLMTGVVVIGGSNLAKAMYYNTVMSRKEEVAAQKSGQNQADIRANALVKKVRQTRDEDITRIQQEMQRNAVVELEENALVLEFATGVPMEVHYDLAAHDDLMAQFNKTADRAKHSGDASRGVESLTENADDLVADKKQKAKKAAKKKKSKRKQAADEEDVEHGDDDQKDSEALTSGATQAGNSLANLARQTQLHMQEEESTQKQKKSKKKGKKKGKNNDDSVSDVKDARAAEGSTLEVRIMGAKKLLLKAREAHGAWLGMNIHTKRDLMYDTLKKNMDQSDMQLNLLGGVELGTLFSQRI